VGDKGQAAWLAGGSHFEKQLRTRGLKNSYEGELAEKSYEESLVETVTNESLLTRRRVKKTRASAEKSYKTRI
jgi:hypothetical protein